MPRYKILLPKISVVIDAETEDEAIERAVLYFTNDIDSEDLIAWEETGNPSKPPLKTELKS